MEFLQVQNDYILKSRQAAREWHLEVHRGAVHRAMGVGGTQGGQWGNWWFWKEGKYATLDQQQS